MKFKPVNTHTTAAQEPEPRRTPRVAAVRRLEPQRPLRVWSLLLAPTFPAERK